MTDEMISDQTAWMVVREGATEILPRLWVGTDYCCLAAHRLGFKTLCVLESPCKSAGCGHIAICEATPLGIVLRADKGKIEDAVDWIIRTYRRSDVDHVLVHCAAGIERSPLVIAHYLHEQFRMSLDDAYDWIRRHRPIVQDRRAWITVR